jgi:carboxylesterase type B
VYNFSNIRYAQAPVGQLRWSPPVPPVGRNPAVQDGSVGTICPQAPTNWGAISSMWLPYYLAGRASEFNYTKAQSELTAVLAENPDLTFAADPRETEDCLFLDVFVPKEIFDSGESAESSEKGRGAPVLVWQVHTLYTERE